MQVPVRKQSKYIIGVLMIVLLAATFGVAQGRHTVVPKDGFVPDQETALKIAEAVWLPIYGAQQIDREKPFVAKLKDDVWTVSGTLHGEPGSISKGGVAIIKISKTDARVLEVSHGK